MTTRNGRRRVIAAAMAPLLAATLSAPAQASESDIATSGDTVVVQWNAELLAAIAESDLGPPMIARATAILHTCVYDAWAAYDPIAAGTQYGHSLDRPIVEWTRSNKRAAISYAAHTAAVDLLPDARPRFDALMADLGYPLDADTTASDTGRTTCQAVLDYRHQDGANQSDGYADTTGYQPVNEPMVVAEPLDPSTVHDPNRWQPLIHPTRDGASTKTQEFIAPHWGDVEPFALRSWDEFDTGYLPPRFGTKEYRDQAKRLIDVAANLTDRQKVIAEYWADGPGTEQPPGHWAQIGQFVSRRDNHGLGADAKLFFALTNAIFDASIASWGQKSHYDYVRPITAVRYLFRGEQIPSWNRAHSGPELIDGAEWTPYQPTWFPSPPFAEYTSGHSAFSAAGAEILKRFTGSDTYGDSVTVPAGSSDVEPGVAPTTDVTLSWDTFTEASNEAGISRRYGGIHFTDADLNGRKLGRRVAGKAWEKATAYFRGALG